MNPLIEDQVAKFSQHFAASKEQAILERVGVVFRSSIRVRIQRPKWMPNRLYNHLMRTIVVEEGPLVVEERLP